jgi:hypothetical protein
MYEGESINRSQMDIECKTCDIQTWKKKHLFLDIFCIHIDTLVPSLYQCIETCSLQVFWLLSQPLLHLLRPHLRLSNSHERISWPSFELLYWKNTSHLNRKHFFMIIFCIESFCPQKRTTECCSLVVHPLSRVVILLLKPASEHGHAHLLPRLSWSCYLVIHIENLLYPLQLFHFHLLPISWLHSEHTRHQLHVWDIDFLCTSFCWCSYFHSRPCLKKEINLDQVYHLELTVTEVAGHMAAKSAQVYRIWGCHSSGYEEFCLLRYNTL